MGVHQPVEGVVRGKVITRSHFSVSLVRNSGRHPPDYRACCSSRGSLQRCRSCHPAVQLALIF